MTTDYRAIACDQHSLLELLALRRLLVEVEAVDEGGDRLSLHGTVIDLVTRDCAEYLVLQASAGESPIPVRLDRLRRITDPAAGVVWRQ